MLPIGFGIAQVISGVISGRRKNEVKKKEKPHYVYSNLLKMPVLKGSVKIYHRPENNKHKGVCGFAIDGEFYLEGEASAEYRKWLYKEAEKLNGKGGGF